MSFPEVADCPPAAKLTMVSMPMEVTPLMRDADGPKPRDEEGRLRALRRYEVLDSEPEPAFDRLTRLASRTLDAPVALITLVDEYRQWIKSECGVTVGEVPRQWAFCAHAILTPDDVMVVEDARRDARFCDNPLVVNDPHIRFYAGAPLVTHDGHALGALCIIDTKDRPPLAEDGRQILKDLADTVVDELELRLALREASEAASMAEQLNTAKSAFLASVSHELRTPMNAIIGFGQLLALEPAVETDQSKSYLRHILDSGEHLLALLNDLIELSRIESGESRLDLQPLLASGEVDNAIGMLSLQASQYRISVVNELTDDTTVLADRVRFRQVVLNLLSNAIKYNRPDGSVCIRAEPAGSDMTRIVIRDSGIGIPPDRTDRLFRPYDRLDRDQCDTAGVGLGLVIARRMARAMGGDVALVNCEEGGCRAIVTLPDATQGDQAPAAAAATGEDLSAMPALRAVAGSRATPDGQL